MIITRTPFRISFFGGGTDFPPWFIENGGAVISTTIDKYCYITCRYLPPFFEHRHRIVYSKIENVQRIEEIQHPAVRGVLSDLGVVDGIEIHHDGDLPARSGLGSSSSFTVGLLHAINALEGRMSSKQGLAESAIRIEQDVLAENVGCQDQIAVAHGGFNRIDFLKGGGHEVRPVVCTQDRLAALEGRLMLFFTGVSRFGSQVAAKQVANIGKSGANLERMREQVDTAVGILSDPSADMDDFGRLLHEAWQLKKGLSDSISTAMIDEIYARAMTAGAIGGKILGAGGGGFILFFVPPERRRDVARALDGLTHVPFHFERDGSQVVYYKPSDGPLRPGHAG
ncbi:kinase [Stappia sp.]|uniref:GHMP family kinase ATP-binding protein n=1 Tax=Stappia sp. TaxID=1870903 RepID=UPI003A99DFC8